MNSRFTHRFVVIAILLAAFQLAGGCAGNRVDLAETHQLKVEHVSTKSVRVEEPSVWQQGSGTVVYGRVKRVPGAFTARAGHTHVQLCLSDSAITEEQCVPWSPKWIPSRFPRYSTYQAAYPRVVPPGSAVRVWVCYDDHPSIPGGKVPATVRAS